MNDRASAARIYAGDHPNLARTLRAKLEKERASLAANITDGLAMDWPDYKHRAGVIKGIDTAIQLCLNVESELNGD